MEPGGQEHAIASASPGRATAVTSSPTPYVYLSRVMWEEDQTHEFKSLKKVEHPERRLLEYAGRYINAFLNSSGGTIYFGIEDDGTVEGVWLSREERDTIRLQIDALVEAFWPSVDCRMCVIAFVPVVGETKEIPPKGVSRELYIIEIRVSKGTAPVYLLAKNKPSAFVRRNGSIFQMSMEAMLERLHITLPAAGGASPAAPLREALGGGSLDPGPACFVGRQAELKYIIDRLDLDGTPGLGGVASVDTGELAGPLSSSGSNRGIRVVSIYGPGGVGKTTLSRRLATALAVDYPGGQFALPLASNPGGKPLDVHDAMVYTIRALHPTLPMSTPTAISPVEIEGYYLSCFRERKVILHLDDAISAAQVRALLPRLASSCLVIVTSRKNLGLEAAADGVVDVPGVARVVSLALGALSRDEACDMLFRICQNQLTREQAERLADLCGRLPLALRVAAATLTKQRNLRPEQLIERLQGDAARATDNECGRVGSELLLSLEDHCLEKCVRASVDGLSTLAIDKWPELRELFLALSVFPATFEDVAARRVAFETVAMATGNAQTYDEIATQEILSIFLTHSLLDFDTDKWRYRLHDTVRLFARVEAERASSLKSASAAAASNGRTMAVLDVETLKDRFVEYYYDVVANAVKLYIHARPNSDDRPRAAFRFSAELANIEGAMALCLEPGRMGRRGVGLDLFAKFVRTGAEMFALKLLPANHRVLLRMFDEFVTKASSEQYGELVRDADIAFVCNEIGRLAWIALGDATRAEEYYRRALRYKEARLHDSATLDYGDAETASNVATAYARLGELCLQSTCDYAEAKRHFSMALAIRERFYGNQSAVAAHTRLLLGRCYLALARYDEARRCFETARGVFAAAGGGADSADVALALDALGSLETAQGHYVDAQRLYEQSLAIKERLVGVGATDDLGVAATRHKLGKVATLRGQYEEAERYYEMARVARQKVLGVRQHPLIAKSIRHLAFLYFYRGDPNKAERMYKEALEMLERMVGPQHLEVAIILNDLALIYNHHHRFDQSEPLLRRSLAIRRQLFSPYRSTMSASSSPNSSPVEHPYIAIVLNNLGNVYRGKREFEKAMKKYRAALHIREQRLGSRHPEVARTLHNMATCLCHMKKYEEAERLFLHSLELRREAIGDAHPEIATAKNGIGMLYECQKRYEDAERCYLDALKINMDAFLRSPSGQVLLPIGGPLSPSATSDVPPGRPPHPSIVVNYYKLGNLYRMMKQFEKAEQFMNKYLMASLCGAAPLMGPSPSSFDLTVPPSPGTSPPTATAAAPANPAAADADDPAVRARTVVAQFYREWGDALYRQRQFDEAAKRFERALRHFKELNDRENAERTKKKIARIAVIKKEQQKRNKQQRAQGEDNRKGGSAVVGSPNSSAPAANGKTKRDIKQRAHHNTDSNDSATAVPAETTQTGQSTPPPPQAPKEMPPKTMLPMRRAFSWLMLGAVIAMVLAVCYRYVMMHAV